MYTRTRSTSLSGLTALLALAAALFLFSPVMAEGEAPAPEAPSAPEALPPVESPGATGGSGSDEEVAGESPSQPLETSQLELYLSSDGVSDPYFKVGSTTYRWLQDPGGCVAYPGDVCFDNEPEPINAALDYMDINSLLPSDRYLYIEEGAYIDTDEVDINGSASPVWVQLKGIIGEVDPDTYEPLVAILDAFQITNMPGGFYLKGLNVVTTNSVCTSAVCFNNNGGTLKLEDVWIQGTSAQDYGLSILNHNGSVEFNRVKVNGNPENGARIETTTASGSIKITSSSFDDNGGAAGVKQYNGLRIVSNQVITLNGFSASGNTGTGLNILRRLDGREALARNLTIKNATFNNNISGDAAYGFGVRLGAVTGPDFLYPAGNLVLENAVAVNNDESGFLLYNNGDVTIRNILTLNNTDQGTYVDTLDSGKVTVSQVRHEGGGNSLYITNTAGAVTVTGLQSVNGRLYISNSGGSGNITLTDVSVIDTTNTGITLYSNGSVTLKDVQSNNNGNIGILIQTFGSGGVSILGGSGILNEASENDTNGLYIVTNGAIKIANMVTNGNGNPGAAYGMVLVNDIFGEARNVTLTDVQASNNYQDGIYLTSLGTITLNGVIANNNGNGGDGIELPNSTSVKNVTIQPTKATPQNQFDNNAGTGAVIVTQGAVTLKQVSASGNVDGGVLINIAAVGKAVSIDGGVFDGNELFGLDIFTAGKITLKDISASNNGVPNDAYGAVISNQNASNNNPVSISNGRFSYNEGSGLVVRSFGAVTLSNITAISNDYEVDVQRYQGIGIDVDNSFGKGGVTISASKPQDMSLNEGVYSNQRDGVRVKTTGAIVVKNITSSINGVIGGLDEFGFNLNNALGINTGILLTNLVADNNRGDGVNAISTGAISVNGLQASENDGAGMSGQTISPGKAQKISVSNSETNSNSDTGMLLVNEGAVLLTNIISNLNSFLGVVVYNNGPTFISPVTLKSSGGKTNQINGNTFVGLFIESNGAITVSDTEVNGNYGPRAAYLDNDYQLKAQKVTVSNSSFNDNFDPGASTTIGLEILSLGNISLSGVSASGNESFGVSSNNDTSADHKGTFTVSKSSFDNNGNDGLFAETLGKITLKDVSASGNAFYGLDIDNDAFSGTASISITNLVVNANQSGGANLDSDGSVTITNATVHENTGVGLDIDHNNGSGKVTLKSIFANYNDGKGIAINAGTTVSISNAYVLGSASDGIEVQAEGFAVSITNSSAVGNGGYGIEIDNDQLAPINLTGTVFGGNVSGDLDWD